MTSKTFINAIATKGEISKKAAKEMSELIEATIADALMAGETFKFADINFTVVDVPAHEGRNPMTGEKVAVPASKKVKIAAAKNLKDAVKGK